MNFIIFGAPGSGKGTYASRLKSKLGIVTLATGDIFRELAKEETSLAEEVKTFLERGKLVPDEIVINVLGERLKEQAAEGMIRHRFCRCSFSAF